MARRDRSSFSTRRASTSTGWRREVARRTFASDIMGERYKHDFRLWTAKEGWAKLDSRPDAPYYGQWFNPLTLKLFSYCEGDTTLTECDDEADFAAEVRECIRW